MNSLTYRAYDEPILETPESLVLHGGVAGDKFTHAIFSLDLKDKKASIIPAQVTWDPELGVSDLKPIVGEGSDIEFCKVVAIEKNTRETTGWSSDEPVRESNYDYKFLGSEPLLTISFSERVDDRMSEPDHPYPGERVMEHIARILELESRFRAPLPVREVPKQSFMDGLKTFLRTVGVPGV